MIESIVREYNNCCRCTNCLTSTKVFGTGPVPSIIALIGEGPGKEEVRSETPFVGRAGQLLDKILISMRINRDDIYITNSVICRTNEKNRVPTKEEYSNCRSRLFKELSIVKPKIVILAGSIAFKNVFGDKMSITKEHGNWYTTLMEPCFLYFPIFHPAHILHSMSDEETERKKAEIWEDIKKFRKEARELVNYFYPTKENR